MRSGKSNKLEHGRKYSQYFARMVNHPTGWPLLYQDTPRDVLSIRVSIGPRSHVFPRDLGPRFHVFPRVQGPQKLSWELERSEEFRGQFFRSEDLHFSSGPLGNFQSSDLKNCPLTHRFQGWARPSKTSKPSRA